MRLARSGLCVAISAATPSDRTIRSSSSNTTLLVPTSRLPVGSSASSTPGALAERARDRDPLLLAAGQLARQMAGAAPAAQTRSAAPSPGPAPPACRCRPATICGSTMFSTAVNSAKQMVRLINEANAVAADRGAVRIRQLPGVAAVHHALRPRPDVPAGPPNAAACSLPVPDGATSATISPACRVRSAPSSTRSVAVAAEVGAADAPEHQRLTHGAAPRPGSVRAARQLG